MRSSPQGGNECLYQIYLNSGQDISLKTMNVNLMVAQEEKSGDHQSDKDTSSRNHGTTFCPMHPLGSEIFL